jgi:hypothetical protein
LVLIAHVWVSPASTAPATAPEGAVARLAPEVPVGGAAAGAPEAPISAHKSTNADVEAISDPRRDLALIWAIRSPSEIVKSAPAPPNLLSDGLR